MCSKIIKINNEIIKTIPNLVKFEYDMCGEWRPPPIVYIHGTQKWYQSGVVTAVQSQLFTITFVERVQDDFYQPAYRQPQPFVADNIIL